MILAMECRYTKLTLVWAAILVHITTSTLIVMGCYFFRNKFLNHKEGAAICIASFTYICATELLAHVLHHSSVFFDL